MKITERFFSRFRRIAPLALACGVLAGCATQSRLASQSPAGAVSPLGEYGASLDFLRQFVSGPAAPGESNFFIDMWDNGQMRHYAREHGLTNNHALFVISHGGGIKTTLGPRYAYFPDPRDSVKNKNIFSARDLAQVLGPDKLAGIHNLVIAGCNFDNTFSSTELRLLFPNATNIVHSLPGKNAHETLFRHALIYTSRDVKTLYLQPDNFQPGFFDETWREKKVQPYIAELFRPGELSPYKIQTAGRELLERNWHYAAWGQIPGAGTTAVN